jgi:uncharacterized protein (TIRG00374 family)
MKIFHQLSITAGIILLVLLIWGVGPGRLWHELALLGWGLAPLILIEGIANIFHTFGWRHCLSEPYRSLSFFHLFRIRMAGVAINHLTPTADLGGEITRGALLSLYHQSPQAASGVIVGKLSYTLAQMLFVVCGSLFVIVHIDLPQGVGISLLWGSILIGSGLMGFLTVQKYGKLGTLLRWCVNRNIGGIFLKKLAHHITDVDNALQLFYKDHQGDLYFSMFWHTVGLACGIVQSWYFFYLVTEHTSLLVVAGAWFLGSWFDMLSFAVPSNIGVLEGTRVLALHLLGFASSTGLAYGIALRLEQLTLALCGMLLYATLLSSSRVGENKGH